MSLPVPSNMVIRKLLSWDSKFFQILRMMVDKRGAHDKKVHLCQTHAVQGRAVQIVISDIFLWSLIFWDCDYLALMRGLRGKGNICFDWLINSCNSNLKNIFEILSILISSNSVFLFMCLMMKRGKASNLLSETDYILLKKVITTSGGDINGTNDELLEETKITKCICEMAIKQSVI